MTYIELEKQYFNDKFVRIYIDHITTIDDGISENVRFTRIHMVCGSFVDVKEDFIEVLAKIDLKNKEDQPNN